MKSLVDIDVTMFIAQLYMSKPWSHIVGIISIHCNHSLILYYYESNGPANIS